MHDARLGVAQLVLHLALGVERVVAHRDRPEPLAGEEARSRTRGEFGTSSATRSPFVTPSPASIALHRSTSASSSA